MSPTLHTYIRLEDLLKGYSPDPIFSKECITLDTDTDDGRLAGIIMEVLSLFAGDNDCYTLETLVIECVDNIREHDYGKGDVKFFLSTDQQRFIGMMELYNDTQFGSEKLATYEYALRKTQQLTASGNFAANLYNEDDHSDHHLGTALFFLNPAVTRLGIADVEGRAYFFFEYRIPNI